MDLLYKEHNSAFVLANEISHRCRLLTTKEDYDWKDLLGEVNCIKDHILLTDRLRDLGNGVFKVTGSKEKRRMIWLT